jgi:leader peptidase (prepilin peptidase)/N-methyltransferase
MFLLINLIVLCFYFTYTDIRYRIIPNGVIYPALYMVFFWRLLEPSFFMGLIPALLLVLFFWFMPNAIGGGDIKLIALIGLVIGLELTWCMLFYMACSGAIYYLFVRLLYKFQGKYVPLAPFITVGVLLVYCIQL